MSFNVTWIPIYKAFLKQQSLGAMILGKIGVSSAPGGTERGQWWRYTRVCQVLAGILAGRSTALAPPCLALRIACFASVIVWTENKYVTISDRFICFDSETVLTACVLRATTKEKVIDFFEEKSVSRWPGGRISLPQNDLALLLCCRHHCKGVSWDLVL